MDEGAWWAAVHGIAKRQAWLSHFTFTFHFHALDKEMATHSNVLAWRIPGTGEPGGLPSMGLHRVGHDWSDTAAAAAATSPRPPLFFWEKLLMPLTVPCKFRQACPLSPTLHTPNTHLRLAWFQNSSTLPELAPPLASMCSWHPSGWRRPRSEAGGGDGES